MATIPAYLRRSPSPAGLSGSVGRRQYAALLPRRPLVGSMAEYLRVGRALLFRHGQPAGISVPLLAVSRAFPFANGRLDGPGAARRVPVPCALRSRSPALQPLDGDDPPVE